MNTLNKVKKTELKRTNTNAFKGIVYRYILDALEVEENEGLSDAEKINWMASEFERVAGHPFNLQRHPNEQERFADYLSQLPFDIDFMNDDILETSKKWHEVEEFDEKTGDMIVERWFSFLAVFCLRLINDPSQARLAS